MNAELSWDWPISPFSLCSILDNQESEEDDEDEDEEDQIETVNAVTRGESFLEPQQEHASPVSQSYVPNHETYGQTLETVLDRMNSLGSVVRNLSNLVEAQAGTHVDDRVTATLTAIQQQLDTLMARMVLVENRVALVEARLGETRVSFEARLGETRVRWLGIDSGLGENMACYCIYRSERGMYFR